MEKIFVYGTLKTGQPNYHRMLDSANGKAKLLCTARTVDAYPLVIAGKYNIPFLINLPGKGQRVQGEIYCVDHQMLKFLDWFESCPHLYQRTQVLLEVQDWFGEANEKPAVGSTIDAFVYSTTAYEPDWLQNEMFESYDTNGTHGLTYVFRESRDTD